MEHHVHIVSKTELINYTIPMSRIPHWTFKLRACVFGEHLRIPILEMSEFCKTCPLGFTNAQGLLSILKAGMKSGRLYFFETHNPIQTGFFGHGARNPQHQETNASLLNSYEDFRCDLFLSKGLRAED